MAVSPAERITMLVKSLEQEAVVLREEVQRLQSERARWMSAVASDVKKQGADAAGPYSGFPQAYAKHLSEAATCERRCAQALRKALTKEAEANRMEQERIQVRSSEEKAVSAANERAQQAKQQLEQLRLERKEAEKAHSQRLAEMEANTSAVLQRLEQRAEEARGRSQAVVQVARKDRAKQQASHPQSLEEVRAAAERERAALQASVDDHDRRCQLDIRDAGRRMREAQEKSASVWKDMEDRIKGAQLEADQKAEQLANKAEVMLSEARKVAAEIEAEVQEELQTIARREHAVTQDRSPEERARIATSAAQEAILVRQAQHDAFSREYQDETARLLQSAKSCGDGASARAHAAQTNADAQIEEMLKHLEASGAQLYEGRIRELQEELTAAVRKAREEVEERMQQFDVEASEQAKAAAAISQTADQRVKHLREEASRKVQDELKVMQQGTKLASQEQTLESRALKPREQ